MAIWSSRLHAHHGDVWRVWIRQCPDDDRFHVWKVCTIHFAYKLLVIVTVCFRFTAICFPLRPSLHSDVQRSRVIILIIWIVSMVLSLGWIPLIKVSDAEDKIAVVSLLAHLMPLTGSPLDMGWSSTREIPAAMEEAGPNLHRRSTN